MDFLSTYALLSLKSTTIVEQLPSGSLERGGIILHCYYIEGYICSEFLSASFACLNRKDDLVRLCPRSSLMVLSYDAIVS
jgi:hypothetical protein